MVDDIFDRVREAVDRTLGGAMGDLNRSLGRLVKAVYAHGWKARDDATRQRLVRSSTGGGRGGRPHELSERSGRRLTRRAQLRLMLDDAPTSP